MTDPIQAFMDNGGFRKIADPRGEGIRLKAEALTCTLIHAYLDKDADALATVVPELLDGIVSADEFGAGPLASLQLLGQAWRDVVGVHTTFTPPESAEDGDLLASAAGLASVTTLPTVAVPVGAVQNPDAARLAIMMLARQLALRLDAARSLADRVNLEAQKFWAV